MNANSKIEIHFSVLAELRDRSSRSKLFCFFSICILRTRSASESVRSIVKSSCGSLDGFGGNGGRRSVYDSSTCGISNVVVCLRLGRGILISTSAPTFVFWLSSNSGVDVHDDGRFGLTATHIHTHTHRQHERASAQANAHMHTNSRTQADEKRKI